MKNMMIALGAGALMILLAWLAHRQMLLGQYEKFFSILPSGEITTSLGEVIANDEIEQEIELPASMFDGLPHATPHADMCLSMLMATYARTNTARYRVSLHQGAAAVEQEISAVGIRDNALHQVCFPSEALQAFAPGSALLRIKGLDGKPGNAITFWLTNDPTHGVLRRFFRLSETFGTAVKRVNLVPAGEFVAGMAVRQTLDISEKLVERMETSEAEAMFCLALTMATYARQNTGSLVLTLTQDHWRWTKTLDVRYIRNNADHHICFTASEWSGVQKGSAVLEMTGVDGQPGNAVTLWLTEDTSQGMVTINGRTQALSLCYAIGRAEPLSMIYSVGRKGYYSLQHFIIRNLLVLFYACLVFLLVFIWLTHRKTLEDVICKIY